MSRKTKKADRLTVRDLLSHLDYATACKLLGSEGAALIRHGGVFDIDPSEAVEMTATRVRLRVDAAVVSITRSKAARQRLEFDCSRCNVMCIHVGAALSLILEEKMTLGLAAPPPERVPVESLNEEELVARALEDREARSRTDKMRARSVDPKRPWTDYTVSSVSSGKTYRVALRGRERGISYCSCPDYRKNTLGTCKHIMYVLRRAESRFRAADLRKSYRRRGLSLYLRHGAEVELRLALPAKLDPDVARIVKPLIDRPITKMSTLMARMRRLHAAGHDLRVYPDAEEYIDARLFAQRIDARVAEIRADTKGHPLRTSLLDAELLPYQLDGIAFAVGAGRAILADDMGLGKTIQGIGVAELFAREAGISRVLVICPTTLKAQWRSEIQRFASRDSQLVLGRAAERPAQYESGAFFTICNYEQVLRDILSIERVPWGLIILDEGQRIKNWEAKTSRVVKSLRSRFALVLTGTPLENRLDDLYSIIEFIDDRRLGPAFRFLNQHRVTNERGRVLGYKNLAELRRRLAPVLLRRTRAEVLRELPSRTTDIVRITPTDEQLELHSTHMRVVSSIVRKSFISEMDLLRLQKALLMCRLTANSTYLVTREAPGYSSKLDALGELFDRLAAEDDRKIVLFSEWKRMLDLIEPLLAERGLGYVRLDGSVPQKKRAGLVASFKKNADRPFFITTNAGSVGLNLQAANTVINVDLPWNPALLEQRVARVHRMGQRRPVQAFFMVTEGTIEESLLGTLSAKHELARAALDIESEVDAVDLQSGVEELRRRLEVLIGAKPEAPLDVSQADQVREEIERQARRERVATAAGQMLTGAFQMIGELMPEAADGPSTKKLAEGIEAQLAELVTQDADGRAQLTITLPPGAGADDPLSTLARSVARLLSASGG